MAPQRTAPLVATPLRRAATGQPAATAATTAGTVPLGIPPRLVELGEVARLGEGGAELRELRRASAAASAASPASSIAATSAAAAAAAAAATHCRATER